MPDVPEPSDPIYDGPPRTDAASHDPAPPSAGGYWLAGTVEVTRDALGGAAAPRPIRSSLPTRAVSLAPKQQFAPGARRADALRGRVRVEPDDLLEVEFDRGERLWMRADDFRNSFGAPLGSRGPGEGGELEVPLSLPLTARGLQTRGPVAWAIKGLKVFGVDLAGLSAEALAARVDFPTHPSKQRQAPGVLYRCGMTTGAFDLLPVDIRDDDDSRPWLLFIHGTLSSTWGSFGELWSGARAGELAALGRAYGDRVIAFEHATLTESPLLNARSLAAQLPFGARLHVVTHSRGGLIGELLCRGRVAGRAEGAAPAGAEPLAPFTDEEQSLFAAPESAADEGTPPDLQALRELGRLLQERAIVVERFVRVACPALGTTLASGRLDRWLSVIGTVAGAALPGTPLADVFADLGDFVAAVVKQRTNPATLPGLEAQMPDSRCIRLVNWPGVRVGGDLAVIAGDIDPSALWARLLVWLSDRFYEGDHDLVVNTPSMLGGARRSGAEVVSAHKGASVNHFSYFSEAASASRLVSALTSPEGPAAGFEALRPPTAPIARAAAPAAARPRPVVFVLPGIMGSELADAQGPVWMALLSLLRGGLERLRIEAAGITPTSPVARYYAGIANHLGATHRVVPFAYDWRLDLAAEADRLAGLVREELAAATRQGQPIRFLAHSMGGLVVRALIARHAALWREICENAGARLVMLGTPNGGSHAITELLVGQSAVLRKLARLDLRNDRGALLGIVRRYPGVLAMLPRGDGADDYFSADIWRDLHAEAGAGWEPPTAADLDRARQTRSMLDAAPLDPRRVLYVAGSADVTVAGLRVVEDRWRARKRIELLGTARGDGRVTWDSGIPPSVPVWYMDVAHGDLAAHPPSFDALTELLTQGTTTLLDRAAPVARAAAELFPLPPAEDDRYPDEADLAASALGAGPRRHRTRERVAPLIEVKVVHGNLAFSRHPIAVGHYTGDTIVSAEAHLDRALDGALLRRHHLGLYPGAIETCAIFMNARNVNGRRAGLPGAIVVGLGTVGSLTASQLTRTFARGLLEYVAEHARMSGADDEEAGLDVSALLIGTGAGGLSVADSVYALVRGALRANATLEETRQPQRIRTLEFVELWEDRALQAMEALHMLSARPAFRGLFRSAPDLEARDGGLRRLTYDEPAGWWQRLQVLGGARQGEAADGALRFASVTRRARTEVRLLATERRLVDRYIEQALATTHDDRAIARTLFDLLLPNDLKDAAPDQDNVVLLLDEVSARYPWELLEDSLGGGGRPWAIEHGVLRQLESEEFRGVVQMASDATALVIGDPVSEFVELPGAQKEAEAVWRTLQPSFTAIKHIRPRSQEVVNALFARPYRVLHLAGHGVYNYVPPDAAPPGGLQGAPGAPGGLERRQGAPISGMVLGDDVYLTPLVVQQMRRVPDLVFINCCHLGRIEPPAGSGPEGARARFPQLAANLATQFIRIGVRAVVAAGWAVDDGAAEAFASAFYGELMKGRPFGEAVHQARCAAFDGYPGSNTWGAYQCYGDPEYRLVLAAGGASSQASIPRIVSPAHAVQELSNIAARLKTGAGSRDAEIARADRIREVIDQKGWSGNGGVTSALARAYGEAGRPEEAVALYRRSLAAEDADVLVRDIEQLANLEARRALQQWEQAAAGSDEERERLRSECAARIRRAISSLETLTGAVLGASTEPCGETAERLALLGSAWKRLALVQTGADQVQALEQMERRYREAAALAASSGREFAYPMLNAVSAALVRRWRRGERVTTPPKNLREALAGDLSAARKELAESLARSPSFWRYIGHTDAELLEQLVANRLTTETSEQIREAYLAQSALASPRELGSVFGQIDFLLAMAPAGAVRDQLDALRARLRNAVGGGTDRYA